MKKKNSLTLRFKVFQKDGFSCQYCGKKPPDVVLEVDHIIPKSKGGNSDLENLITACFDCNRGKSNKSLKDIPKTIERNFNELKERKKQLKEFYSYQIEVEKSKNKTLKDIKKYWSDLFDGEYTINIRGEANIKRFLSFGLDKEEIKEAMAIARGKGINDIERTWKYFCGVIWTKLRNKKELEEYNNS